MPRIARYFLAFALALFAAASTAAERVTYFVPDAQGSPVAAMDAQGNLLWRESYAPYGQRQAKPAANNAQPAYTGKPEDRETGLVYMGARAYDPETARFTGIDPQGFSDTVPQSFGRYVYANNSPYRYADPNGESPVDVVFLAYDAVSFAAAVSSGNGAAIASSGSDLAASVVGLLSPVPGTGQFIKAAKGSEKLHDIGSAVYAGSKSDDKVIYIGKMADLENIPKNQTILDELPNLGNTRDNYYQNMSVLRGKIRDGYEVRDASRHRANSDPDPTARRPDRTVGQSFLGAERNQMDNKGFRMNSDSGIYEKK